MNSETYKIAICDDSQADVEYIAKLVKEWAKDKIVVMKAYPSAEAFMFNYAEEKDYDIVPLTVVNTKGFDLPQTGDNGVWMYGVIGILAMAASVAAIVIVCRKKKPAENE